MNDINLIRNFSIIAHIDHGKSTLADRLIQECKGLEDREMKEQVLDNMDIERERGITIKAQTVRLLYKHSDNQTYTLNLMDTPGHVDFAYEVSRSLSACEGSLLVIDSSQGVEAQTLANVYQAIDVNHEIVTVLNKIDLPASEPERIRKQIEDVIGLPGDEAIEVSAKTGQGIKEVLSTLVEKLAPPTGNPDAPLQALLIDSWYDPYLGVLTLVRVVNGTLKKGQKIRFMSTKVSHTIEKLGIFTPKIVNVDQLGPGEVGFITASVKAVADCKVGDTITDDRNPVLTMLPGFKPSVPVVFCGLFPMDNAQFSDLREALSKLSLNDASFSFEAETSAALGFGFRCGFLGLLHMEIIRERLSREYDLDFLMTVPSVTYKVEDKSGEVIEVKSPKDLPDENKIKNFLEPIAQINIITPSDYLGPIIELCVKKRGSQTNLQYRTNSVEISFEVPLSEIIYDFFDKLKSCTKGYASYDYTIIDYVESKMIKLD